MHVHVMFVLECITGRVSFPNNIGATYIHDQETVINTMNVQMTMCY